jgi:hypothetical protein
MTSYVKHVNLTTVKQLTVSTVLFTNGQYETVIFNGHVGRVARKVQEREYYNGIATPGKFLIVGMQYRHFTKREAMKIHRTFVQLLNSYA